MRCSCHVCDTYMVHSEGLELGCVCPECGYRCKACLGTDSVISRDALRHFRDDPAAMLSLIRDLDAPEPEDGGDDFEEDHSRRDG